MNRLDCPHYRGHRSNRVFSTLSSRRLPILGYAAARSGIGHSPVGVPVVVVRQVNMLTAKRRLGAAFVERVNEFERQTIKLNATAPDGAVLSTVTT